ncbi:MAG TPA: AsmA family protein [bacterium]|nr:AsmA family protein [bacterium]
MGAVVFVVAAGAATPFLVPVDRYRPLLEQYLTSSTGHQVQIGSLRLELWPRVHVHASDVRLLNPTGFPRGNALEARSVDLGIEPRALLARRLQIRSIAVSGVQVTLLNDPAGRTNYGAPALPHPSPPVTAAAPGAQPLISLAPIGAITITNVTLTVDTLDARHEHTAPVVTLSGLNATVGAVDPSAPDWMGHLSVTATLTHARIVTPLVTMPIVVQSGKIELRDGRSTATFAVTLGTIRASGTAAIVGMNPPLITFAAEIPELDLTTVRRLLSTQPGSSLSGPPGPRRLIARGEVTVNRAVVPPFTVTQIHSHLAIYTDTVRADPYQLSAYGGTVRGSARVDYAEANLPAAATAVVRGVNLADLLRAAAPQNPGVTGTLQANLDVSTAFGADPLAALAGTGTFAVVNGTLPGISMPSQLAQMAKSLQVGVPGGTTAFRSLGGDVRIARERVYSTALRLDANAIRGTAHGSVGFDGTLNYTGTGVVSLTSGGALSPAALLSRIVPGAAGVTTAVVSFSIGGTVSNPKFAATGVPQLTGGQTSGQPQPQVPSLPNIPGLPPALQNLLHGNH